VQTDPKGVYRIYAFLVTYGEILHNDDAAAEMIIAPTDSHLQSRYNPSAFSPIVVIKNIGKNSLKTVEIKYGFEGQNELSQTWNGNLGFLQKDTVVLEKIPDWNKIENSSAKFYFELVNPNGTADPTPQNNTFAETCTKPIIFTQNKLYFAFKTNKKPKQTSWKLTDARGEILYSIDADTLKASKTYSADMNLANGTYCLSLYDSNGDGLGWWANNDGNGSAKLQYFDETGKLKTLYNFNVDFGNFVNFWFAVNEYSRPLSQNAKKGEVPIFPNPASEEIFLDLTNIDGQNLSVLITDLAGNVMLEQPVNRLKINRIGVQGFNSGIFLTVIKDAKKRVANGKFIKK
jgi:hypothetical protein